MENHCCVQMRFLGAKYAKNTFDLQRSPDSLAGFKGSTSREGGKERGEEEKEREGERSKIAKWREGRGWEEKGNSYRYFFFPTSSPGSNFCVSRGRYSDTIKL